MKKALPFLTLLLVISSCTTNKLHQRIASHYPYYEEFETTDSSETIEVNPSQKLTSKQQLSYVKHIKKQYIPLLLFTKWDQMYKCELDYKQELEKLCSDMKAACYRNKLDSIIPNQKLELSIESAPFTAVYQSKGFYFIFFTGYVYKIKQSIFPMIKENLIVHYKLYSNKQLVKEGEVSVEDNRTELVGPFVSIKKVANEYVSQTREQLSQMKEEFITKLETELVK